MARIYYDFVEFHSPIFSTKDKSGKNHGTKISAKEGVELFYDSDLPNAKMCLIHNDTVVTMDSYHTAQPKPGSLEDYFRQIDEEQALASGVKHVDHLAELAMEPKPEKQAAQLAPEKKIKASKEPKPQPEV